jgi:hypothetical protein
VSVEGVWGACGRSVEDNERCVGEGGGARMWHGAPGGWCGARRGARVGCVVEVEGV